MNDDTQRSETRPGLNKVELARHLSIERSSLPRVLAERGLHDVMGRYPEQRILRAVHHIEGSGLVAHLALLKLRHTQAHALQGVKDLRTELMAPLMTFDEMARALGQLPGTLSRALREWRTTLPFPEIRLGPRMRRYRPLDVMLWRDEGILLDLPQRLHARALDKPPETQTG